MYKRYLDKNRSYPFIIKNFYIWLKLRSCTNFHWVTLASVTKNVRNKCAISWASLNKRVRYQGRKIQDSPVRPGVQSGQTLSISNSLGSAGQRRSCQLSFFPCSAHQYEGQVGLTSFWPVGAICVLSSRAARYRLGPSLRLKIGRKTANYFRFS